MIIIEVMPISTGSHHEKRVVFLDNMIIWNDKLEENFRENPSKLQDLMYA